MTSRAITLSVLLMVGYGSVLLGGTADTPSQSTESSVHIAWVADTMKRMDTVKVGMTRADLLKVFKTEGGISTPLQRRFVSLDCPYFKVDVRFRAVGRPERDSGGRVIMIEGSQDEIIEISRPYLQFSILD